MNIKDFESKYVEKGGIKKLAEFRSLFFGLDYIAKHYGVSKERVRQWMKYFFGSVYDPREDRKDAIVASMIDFANNHTPEEFRFAFKGTVYYDEAMKLLNNEKQS